MRPREKVEQPAETLVTVVRLAGGGILPAGTYNNRMTFVDSDGNESSPSAATSSVTINTNDRVRLNALPTAPAGFTSRLIYRGTLNPVTNTSIADVLNQTGFGSGPVTIHGYEVYNFARTVGGDTSTTTPSSFNDFKKFAGFMGFVTDKLTGDAKGNVKVVIYDPAMKVLATVYTDADGYYMYAYKHTAKSATYTVKVPAYNKSMSQTVKSNGLMAANFEVP